MIEKRKHMRRPLRIDARYQDRDGTIMQGRVRNIGMGGAYIETRDILDVETTLNLCLDVVDIGKVIDIHSKVVRVTPEDGMAVEFRDKQNKEIRNLLDVMRKLQKASILSLNRVGKQESPLL